MTELKKQPKNETELKQMIEEARERHQEKCHAIKKFLENTKYDYGADSLMLVDYIHAFIGNIKSWIEQFGEVENDEESFKMTNEKMVAAIIYSSMEASLKDNAYFNGAIHKADEINYKIFRDIHKKDENKD